MANVQLGLERLLENPPAWMKGARLGLLCNPASVDSHLRHARFALERRFPGQLKALFSPQHGFFAEQQDNMIESDDLIDPVLKIPVFSLYSHTRIPTSAMFDTIDVLIIDLQDVGTRVYTFMYTVSYCLEVARKTGRRVIVCDRPNPIGGLLSEGNCLEPAYASFVGRYPLPMRHGLTMGELARLFNDHFGIGCDLTVIKMQGWQRRMLYRQTGLTWIAPSPNLPTPESALVYPGQVIWEGTNVSEGRGTTQPFEFFGAPFIDVAALATFVNSAVPDRSLPGLMLRPIAFSPVAGKCKAQTCHGFQLHVRDPETYRPYLTSLKLLQGVIAQHPQEFAWKQPPYEYEYERLPIDLILGSRKLRQAIEQMEPLENLAASWEDGLAEFRAQAAACHLY